MTIVVKRVLWLMCLCWMASMALCAKTPKHLFAYPAGETAIVVCPGGSYSWLDKEAEGHKVARWLQSQGISAYVLYYRVQGGFSFSSGYRYLIRGHQYPDPQNDLRDAMLWLRSHADSLGINPNRIGAMGFSAGGHLVASAGALFDEDARPNFVAPIYPVVTLRQKPFVHKRSRRALLGEYRKWNERWRDSLSLEEKVTSKMPPTFLLNCKDDPIVHYHNSELLDSALTAHQIPHVYIQYPTGGHGFGADENKFGEYTIGWQEKFLEFLKTIE